jgi:hypothetical protein
MARIFDLNGTERTDMKVKLLAGKDGKVEGKEQPQPMPPVKKDGPKELVLAGGTTPGDKAVPGKTGTQRVANPAAPVPPAGGGVDTSQNLQVVLLPDFEEQYAISNCNVLAKTTYDLSFNNGMLSEAAGTFNAVTVPVRILQSVQNALGSKSDTVKNSVDSLPIPGTPATGPNAPKFQAVDPETIYFVVHESYLEPGLYRIQKSWERCAAEAAYGVSPDRAAGLLTEMGIQVHSTVTVLTQADFNARIGTK